MSNFIDLKDLSRDQLLDLVSLSIKWKEEVDNAFDILNDIVLELKKT